MPHLPPFELRLGEAGGSQEDLGCPLMSVYHQTLYFDMYDLEYGPFYTELIYKVKDAFTGLRIEHNYLEVIKAFIEDYLNQAIYRRNLYLDAFGFWEWSQ